MNLRSSLRRVSDNEEKEGRGWQRSEEEARKKREMRKVEVECIRSFLFFLFSHFLLSLFLLCVSASAWTGVDEDAEDVQLWGDNWDDDDAHYDDFSNQLREELSKAQKAGGQRGRGWRMRIGRKGPQKPWREAGKRTMAAEMECTLTFFTFCFSLPLFFFLFLFFLILFFSFFFSQANK